MKNLNKEKRERIAKVLEKLNKMSVEKQKVFWELLSWSKEDLTELKKELEKRKELKKKDLEEKEC